MVGEFAYSVRNRNLKHLSDDIIRKINRRRGCKISDCKLEKIPDKLVRKIEYIDVNKNKIHKIPYKLPTRLIYLDLSYNNLEIIHILRLPRKLVNLNIKYNKLHYKLKWKHIKYKKKINHKFNKYRHIIMNKNQLIFLM